MLKRLFLFGFLLCFWAISSLSAQEAFIGEIRMFGGNFAPRGWALCNGQLLSISSNTALFSILGTTYGGDGRTTFGLPDLRGRVAISEGSGPGLTNHRLGEKGGAETTTLNTMNLPPHGHTVPAIELDPNQSDDIFQKGRNSVISVGNGPNQQVGSANTGGGQSFNNMPPYLTVNYIICVQGIFPSRQ